MILARARLEKAAGAALDEELQAPRLVEGLLDGALAFAGEGSAGASLRISKKSMPRASEEEKAFATLSPKRRKSFAPPSGPYNPSGAAKSAMLHPGPSPES
jgi:hypothetical protein